jgi:CBS domain containing-hemolysin-like protein
VELLAGLVLFALSAFFSSAETALYRADWVRLTTLAGRRSPGARAALDLLERQESTIITILIGNNLVNTFASVIFTGWFARAFGPAWASAAVVLVVVVTMVTGEYVPKSFGAAWPNRILRQAAGPLALLRVIFYPPAALLAGVARLIGPGQPGRRFSLTRQDFITAMTRRNGDQAGTAVGRLVGRLFRFSATKVTDVIIPLDTVCSVPVDADRDRITAVLAEHGFSRIPVYQGEPANITGIVVAKDLLVAPAPRIRRINRVRAGDRAMDVLRRMQRRAEHLVVVEDESGRVLGIVSLEDLLEELVGEIRSES